MKLTTKHQAFISHYLNCWIGAEAARRTDPTYKRPDQVAYEYLRKPEIQEEIQRRLSELKMGSDEVLVRLTDHARGSLAPFMRRSPDGELHGFDLGDEQPLHLLRKVTVTKRTIREMTEEKITLELYDAQAALTLLGKHHGLFVERTETTIDFIGDAAAEAERKLLAGLADSTTSGDPGDADGA